jgi:hypothetical protein
MEQPEGGELHQPTVSIIALLPVTWKAILPTLRRRGEGFRLGFKGEDKWGNPSDQVEGVFSLRANRPIRGLPKTFSLQRGDHAKSIDNLSVTWRPVHRGARCRR